MDQKKKGGRPALPVSQKRKNRVRVHFSDLEIQYLTRKAGDGEATACEIADYVRSQALGRKIHSVPPINYEAWGALARSAGNLNQIAHRLHLVGLGAEVIAPEIKEIQEALAAFRLRLFGEGVFPPVEGTKSYIACEDDDQKEIGGEKQN